MEENTMNDQVQSQTLDVTEDQAQEETSNYSTNDEGDYVLNSEEQEQEEETVQEEVSLGEQLESDEEESDDLVSLGEISESDESIEESEPVEEESYSQKEEKADFDLPEGFDNMISFLKDNPGATPEDYVKATKGSSAYSDEQILKMHLAKESGLDLESDQEEIDFLFDDHFGYDEDLDTERDIKLKKIELKKKLKEAKSAIDEESGKYGGSLTFKDASPETRAALKFYEDHKAESEKVEKIRKGFESKTEQLFSEIKGFDFKYGGNKKQTIKFGDSRKVRDEQVDINNFVSKFVDDAGNITDISGYHKSLWAANNVDALFSHAYEQGKADAVRDAAKRAKNISMDPRQDAGSVKDPSVSKFKLVENDSDKTFKFNI